MNLLKKFWQLEIEVDYSGVGHNWRAITMDEIPSEVVEEIAGEFINGKIACCESFRAIDGMCYRWDGK